MKFVKEFVKQNGIGYVISGGVLSLLGLFIYVKQNMGSVFILGKFLSMLPLLWAGLLVASLGFTVFLGEFD